MSWNVEIKRTTYETVDGNYTEVPCEPVCVLALHRSAEVRLDADNLHVLIDAMNAAYLILTRKPEAKAPAPEMDDHVRRGIIRPVGAV